MRGLVTLLVVTVLLSPAVLAGTEEDWAICRSNDDAKAIVACTSLIENAGLDADQRAEALVDRGISYKNLSDYDRAMADFNEAIRLKPNYANAFLSRGNAYDHQRDYDHAIADYTKAIHLKPDYTEALLNRGMAYNIKRDYDHAIPDLNEAIRLDPKLVWAFHNRGAAYYYKNDYERALSDFNEAIRLDPNTAWAFIGRGAIYDVKGDYDRALADFNEAIRLLPDDADAFNDRGSSYSSKGDYVRAITDFNEAIRLRADYPQPFANRGVARWQLGQQDEAIADLQQALKFNPGLDYARAKLDEFQNTIESGKARRGTEHIAGRRVALVIGNSNYRFLPKLPNAVHDAEAVRDALIAQGYDVTFVRDLPLSETITALDKFRKNVAPSAEKALIWYTGHGQSFQLDDKTSRGSALQFDNFILPIDFNTGDDVVQRGIVLGNVINGVLPAGSVQVVIIDACRSIGEKGAPVGFKGTAKPTAPAPGVEPLTSNLVVVYSTQHGHSSSDGIAGQHSPFAQAFIAQLKEGGAQSDLRAFFLSVGTITNNNAAAIGKEQIPDVTNYITTPKLVTLGPEPK